MGNCCYSDCNNAIISQTRIKPLQSINHEDIPYPECKCDFVIKFPNGFNCAIYDETMGDFIIFENINIWLKNLYSHSDWKEWIVYNDEIPGSNKTSRGHCKGILAWNKSRISWLCHSVPKFPMYFCENLISGIEHSESIYGQSFQYIEIPYTTSKFSEILHQLFIMEANIFNFNVRFNMTSQKKMYIQ